ncbi:MAG: metal ABC transporter solute-binding protein, Zn/Mn family, partial [Alphaproteobacteria bacterium]
MLKVKMLKFRYFICSLLAMCFFSPFIYANEQQSSLLVTIKPLYLLVKPIIGNHIQVDLLLDGKQSPHDLQLTPNMARKLNQASHIVMIDPYFELFLSKHTEISEGKKIWMASDAPDLGFLALRGTHDHGHDEHAHEQHDEHAHEEHDEHGHEQHDEHAHEEHDEHAHEDEAHEEHAHEEHDEHDDQARNLDYHLWLDMNNAVKMARWLNSKLGEAYPEYANEFNQNTAKLIAEIQSAQQVAASRLAPIKDKPFLVFHDGFQYFEQENGLNMQGV